MVTFRSACVMLGIPATKRQKKKWDKRIGIAYRAAQEFGDTLPPQEEIRLWLARTSLHKVN